MNDPKIAIAVFVENAGWGGDVAAPVAALVAERYISKRTYAKKLAQRLMEAQYLPPLTGIPAGRRATPRKDTTQVRRPDTSQVLKPLLTKAIPQTAAPLVASGN